MCSIIRRPAGKGPLALVRRPNHTESNPQVENACQIHQSWERGLRLQHTHGPDNCWSWPEYKSSDALFDIRLSHRLCHDVHYTLQHRKFSYILTHEYTARYAFSQYPLSILIFFIYPRPLSIKFLPLKLSTQQCATDIKITGTKIKKVYKSNT